LSYFIDNYNQIRYPIAVGDAPGLRKAQLGAMHAIASHFTLSPLPAIVVLPTGAGKTAVLAATPYLLRSTRALVVTPSRLVREQIAEEIEELRTVKRLGVLPAEVQPPNTYELTTRISSIDEWNALRQYDIVVAAPNGISPAYAEVPPPPADLFDIILIDEAHHEPAKTWQAVLNAFPNANRVLFTATPFRRDGRVLKGKLAYVYHIRDAHADGIFGRIRYAPVDVQNDTPDVATAKETQRIFTADRQAGLQHYVMVRTDQKTRANELKDIYLAHTTLRLQSINSDHSLTHIKRAIAKLRSGELDGVICVDMMGEGFDFPNLKIAAIHSPHKSLAVTLQFIGRFARTNANDIGNATFVAVPQTVGGELGALYRDGAAWQDIITDLHGQRIMAEQENREILEHFEVPIINEFREEDLSLSSFQPYHHVKVFHVPDPVDIHQEIALGQPFEVIFQSVAPEEDAAVIITIEQQNPQWTDLPIFNRQEFDLFVIYFDEASKLLFINASRRTPAIYEEIARQYTNGRHRNLSLSRVNRVLRDIDNPEFFNVGMKNRMLNPNAESYRIVSGPRADQAIDESDGRLNHRGHVFGKGTVQGVPITIGYSSASKIWSNNTSLIPELIKWCRTLAGRIMNEQPMPALPGLDNLSVGQEITTLPDHCVIAADWHPDTYKRHITVVYPDINGTSAPCEITDLELHIDRANTDQHNVRVIVQGNGWTFPVQFSLLGMPQFAIVDPNALAPLLRRGFSDEAFVDFLNEAPLNFYCSDFSRVAGVEHFLADAEFEPFNSNSITVVDWAAANVDIEVECGPNSIQEHLKAFLNSPDHELLLHDHGAGEMADFLTVGIQNDTVIVKLLHVKGSGGAQPGNRVDDVYEVCGQVVKSLIWLRTPKQLLKKIQVRRAKGSPWIKGTDQRLIQIFDQGVQLGFQLHIGLVQPGISKANLPERMGEVLASARAHLKSAGISELIVLASV
jgi:superfamily II DNA or RNA helicase